MNLQEDNSQGGMTLNNEMTMMATSVLRAGMVMTGRYLLEARLGGGGMGAVWSAVDTVMDEPVALKFISPACIGSQRAVAQIREEAKLSIKLNHQNIAKLMTFELNDGNPFLVMQLIDGKSLADMIDDSGAMTEECAMGLLRPVASALDYAHSMSVIHRDVKPANVMVDKSGCPFVLDFGIAKKIQETMVTLTGTGVSGTMAYMSPQQLRGEKPSPSDDIYSFAAMAYECITGRQLFPQGDLNYYIMEVQPQPCGDSDFCRKIMAGLAKKAEDRPKSCREFFEAIVHTQAEDTSAAIKAFSSGDFKKGLELSESADKSNPDLLFWLGVCYARGEGIPRDGEKANRYFERAAERGQVSAQESLGYGYLCGAWCRRDFQKAHYWLRTAAERGSIKAQCNLAVCYDNGIGVPHDPKMANFWYRRSADSGIASRKSTMGESRFGV